MKNTQKLTVKNKVTGRPESITLHNFEKLDWGMRFFLETELEAYKAAYQYRHNQYGVKVEYSSGASMFMVTVFNELGDKCGFNK
jgi:hypothetical protein